MTAGADVADLSVQSLTAKNSVRTHMFVAVMISLQTSQHMIRFGQLTARWSARSDRFI